MNQLVNTKQRKVAIALWLCLLFASYFLKFTLPVGSHGATLRCFSVILPLIVVFAPKRTSLLIMGAIWLFTRSFALPITAGLPTFCAALSWKASDRKEHSVVWMHVILPLTAMFLFALSPVGRHAWPYTLYWLIPVVCHFRRQTLFSRALQSTFVQHAVGSVIWVYLMPLSAVQWMSLIPVVAVERLLCAGLATAVVMGIMQYATRFHRESLERRQEFWSMSHD